MLLGEVMIQLGSLLDQLQLLVVLKLLLHGQDLRDLLVLLQRLLHLHLELKLLHIDNGHLYLC